MGIGQILTYVHFKNNTVMRRICFLATFTIALLLLSCNKEGIPNHPGMKKVSYTENKDPFPTPERGLYTGLAFDSEAGSPVTVAAMTADRTQGRTLKMIEFWLKDFFESDISEAYLQLIRRNLAVYRQGGEKCILRFGYSNYIKDLKKPYESGPFDPSEEVVLRHIAQLKPILQEYADVIYVLQAGFIGCWGEWYYTNNFNTNPDTEEDFLPRKHVLDALLDALPANRQIEVREPKYKMKIYGYSAADTLTRAEAHQTTAKARVAGHNDCYLADASDQGTFRGPTDREYWKAETQYLIMGGETCGLSKYCECDHTLENMADQHFSYLNLSFDKKVLNYWKNHECYDEIKERLGYRLLLTYAFFDNKPAAGKPFHVILYIRNDGFASLMNPRDAEFVLSGSNGEVIQRWDLQSDPRYWMPATTTVIDRTLQLPDGLNGEYTLSLNMPDPAETLHDNPLFSVRLANKDIWDDETGFNNLYTINL